MATREVSDGTQTTDRWTNEGAQPGYYTGTPLAFQRALTAAEATQLAALDTALAQTNNAQSLQQKAQQALAVNATFQAIASPTNTQNAAQVQALTKQCNGIIRLLLGALDSTTGT